MRCPLTPGSRVWAYTRDSGGDEQSVGDQNRAVMAYCTEAGLILERLFCDEARAGGSITGRDQFQELMRLARVLPEEQLPHGLVVWSFSRFSRDIDDAQFYKASLRRRGVAIIPISDDIPSGNHGRLVEAVMDWQNAQFLETLSHDVKRGLHDIVRQGYAPGGFPPVGYKAEHIQIGTKRNGEPRIVARWIPDPDKAEIVRQAWELRAQGASYGTVHDATHLLSSQKSYSGFFRNRTYLGIRKCGELNIPDAHEALITQELWDAVQATLKSGNVSRGDRWPDDRPHPRRRRSSYLLSGLARCAYCGAAMIGSRSNVNTRPNPWRYYLCGRKKREGYHSCEGRQIGAEPAEAAIMDAVISNVLTPTFFEDLIAEVNVYLDQGTLDLDSQVNAAQKRLAETERAIENLLDLAETFGARAAGTRLLDREAQRDRQAAELRSLELRRQQSTIEVSPEVVLDVIASARRDLESESIQARRVMLKKFVDRVEMESERATLYFAWPVRDLLPTSLWSVPPRELFPKTCHLPRVTVPYFPATFPSVSSS